MRISDWSSDVCSSDLALRAVGVGARKSLQGQRLQPGAAPHRQGIGVSPIFAGPARGDELARIGLGEALHLPEAEAQRLAPSLTCRAVARRLEGEVQVADRKSVG